MADYSSPQSTAQVQRAIQMTRREHYAEALEVFERHLPPLAQGDISDKRLAAAAFSFYGLCVAVVRRRYSEAVKYCNLSLKSNFLDPDHRYNLARVYLERNDRKRAVESLNAGLRIAPKNTQLNTIFDRIGRRRPPVLPFLSRDNPVNVWLGKRFRRHQPTA